MSIKISNFVPLNTPAGNDIIPIIDVSEPNTANQNKKITVDNLLSLATGQENPYIQVTYTEDVLPTAPNGNLIIGESFNKYSDLPYTNRIPDGYNIVLGSFNSINAPNNDTEVYGEFTSPFVRIFGNDNSIGQNCREASIVGYTCGIAYNAPGALIFGTNSTIGDFSNTADPLAVNNYSIAIGDSVNIQGNSCTAIGYVSKIYNKSTNSIAIGTGARIGDTTATTPSDSAIALGDNAKSREHYSISVGYNSISSASYGVAIGAYSEIEAGATDSFCFGGYISSTAEESISIGLYSSTNGPASIAIGPRASANPTTARAIAIGDGSAARAANSIVIGGNNGVINTCIDSISIGDESGIFGNSNNTVLVGTNNNINADCSGSISIGYGNTIFVNSPSCIALGYNANIATNLTNSIQLGTGTVSTSNTLQFGSTKLANSDLGLTIKTNTTAPPVTASDAGTLGLNAGTPQYVNSSGNWVNISSSTSPITTTKGDLIVRNATTDVRQPIGTDGQVLTADSTVANGLKWSTPAAGSGYIDPLTTEGDIVVRNLTTTTRLPRGLNGQVLTVDTGITGALKWAAPAGLPTTTKGDLIVRNATTDVRQPVGSDGQVLIADSSVANGLRWGATPPSSAVDYIYVIPTSGSYGSSENNMLVNAFSATVGSPGITFASGTGLFTFATSGGVWDIRGIVSFSSPTAANRFYIRPFFPTGAPAVSNLFTTPICGGTTSAANVEHHAVVSGRLVLPVATTAHTMRLVLLAASTLSITVENNSTNWGKIVFHKIG